MHVCQLSKQVTNSFWNCVYIDVNLQCTCLQSARFWMQTSPRHLANNLESSDLDLTTNRNTGFMKYRIRCIGKMSQFSVLLDNFFILKIMYFQYTCRQILVKTGFFFSSACLWGENDINFSWYTHVCIREWS